MAASASSIAVASRCAKDDSGPSSASTTRFKALVSSALATSASFPLRLLGP